MLEAQVEDKCGSAVEKGKHSNADVKLCGGCVVSGQVVNSAGVSLIDFAVRNIIRMLHQPVGTHNIFNYDNPKSKYAFSSKLAAHCKGV